MNELITHEELLEPKSNFITRFAIEVKPEQESDTSGSDHEEIAQEDWQIVDSVKINKNYYDKFKSKLNNDPFKEKIKKSQETEWGFWALVVTDYHQVLRTDEDLFRSQIAKGIPTSLRGTLWQVFSNSLSSLLEEKYRTLLSMKSPHEKWIQRDLPRTFPKIEYFNTSQGQEKLFHVIKAYSLWDEKVGYCQGLHFLVGCLLLHMPEEAAFSVLVQLMSKYGLREQFTPNMRKLHERMFQFDQLLLLHVPRVYRHLENQGVLPSMYASQWFMTLFAYRCPLDLVFGVYDVLLVEGAHKMIHFALALMKKNQQTILSLGFESLLEFFNGRVFDAYENNLCGFIKDAYSFEIPRQLLQKLRKQYISRAAYQEKIQSMEEEMKQKNTELIGKYKISRQNYKALDSKYQVTVEELIQSKMQSALLHEENQKLKDELLNTQFKILKLERTSESQGELDTLANENARLVLTNSELQERLTNLETMMVRLKLKRAETENESEMIKKLLSK